MTAPFGTEGDWPSVDTNYDGGVVDPYGGSVQILPDINVSAPRPAVLVPRVIDTTSSPISTALVPAPMATSKTPNWLLWVAVAAGIYWLLEGRKR